MAWRGRLARGGATGRKLDGAGLSTAFAAVNIEGAIYLKAALSSYPGEGLSLGRWFGGEPDGEAGAISVASSLIEELRGLEIAITFGYITAVIQRERIGGVEGVGLHEIAPRRGPVVFILGEDSLLTEQGSLHPA